MALHGELTPPGDKSISHRAFLLGALAEGTTIVHDALESADVRSTREVAAALGCSLEREGTIWRVTGGALHAPLDILDAGNSGTTARLLCGILAGIDGVSVLTGDGSLRSRPMKRVIDPLQAMGATFLARDDGYLPLAVHGGHLTGCEHRLAVASAQVKSALMLAGLQARGTTTITEPLPSRDHSERMLSHFGARIKAEGTTVCLEGPQHLTASEVHVPADPSSAAFPAVWAAATPGSEVLLRNVGLNPTRTAFFAVLRRMGAEVEVMRQWDSGGEPAGDIIIRGAALKATTIGGPEIPALIDEIPILVTAAALATGTTVIRDARELRIKESDRIAAMAHGLNRLGGDVEERPDGMTIRGPLRLNGGHVETHGDHRIAMAFHILARAGGIDISLDETGCVDISYPDFFRAMENLA